MPIRKISDLVQWSKRCMDPDHNPPSHWCPRPGVYEHECPSCGKKTVIRMDGVMM